MKKSYDRITVTFEKLNTTRIKNIGKMSKSDFSRDRKMPLSDIIMSKQAQGRKAFPLAKVRKGTGYHPTFVETC